MKNEFHEQFKLELLRIFQFENQDYNLGIVKLLNFKREQIQNLINVFNPLDVSEDLSRDIYNLVIEFFSQYYKNGVFNSREDMAKILQPLLIMMELL